MNPETDPQKLIARSRKAISNALDRLTLTDDPALKVDVCLERVLASHAMLKTALYRLASVAKLLGDAPESKDEPLVPAQTRNSRFKLYIPEVEAAYNQAPYGPIKWLGLQAGLTDTSRLDRIHEAVIFLSSRENGNFSPAELTSHLKTAFPGAYIGAQKIGQWLNDQKIIKANKRIFTITDKGREWAAAARKWSMGHNYRVQLSAEDSAP